MIKTERQINAMKLLYDDGQCTDRFFRDSFPDVYDTLTAALRVVRACEELAEANSKWGWYEIPSKGEYISNLFKAMEHFAPSVPSVKTEKVEGICGLCGQPMPEGEKMFEYHGYSGNCPSPGGKEAS